MSRYTPVSAQEIQADPTLADWRVVDGSLVGEFLAASFADAGALVAQIATAADEVDHHPDLSLAYPGRVTITMSTHDTGGLTDADVRLAREVTTLAAQCGAAAE